ncbi:MAG: hypothetical protein MJB14_19980 [Spirochaetes bacterium]|nr:hypothetical protein [Spirochaetota bacterium]
MSEDYDLLQLQKETGCDQVLGKLLLKFTANDYDGALRILKSVDKDIIILRGKFIGQTNKIYGSFIIVYNGKLKEIDRVEIIIKHDDKSAIEFDFEKKWNEYLEDIILYLKKNITEVGSQEKFVNLIKSQRTIYFLDSRMLHKKEINDEELTNFFKDLIATVTGDVDVAVKLKYEKTDVFDISRGKIIDFSDIEMEEEEETEKEDPTPTLSENDQILLIRIEPELAPMDGTPLSELQKGDLIGVRIIDERPIAEYIAGLIQAKNFETDELKTVFTSLKDIKLTEGGIFISVEFGPGIYGQAYFGEDVKIKVAKPGEKDYKKEDQDDENFFSRYFWYILGGALLSIGILLIFYLVN